MALVSAIQKSLLTIFNFYDLGYKGVDFPLKKATRNNVIHMFKSDNIKMIILWFAWIKQKDGL